jgi:phage shock protein C
MKWVRAKDGAIFGVCKGLARALDLPLGVLRLLWVLSLLFFGAGFFLYLMLAVSLPREDKAIQAIEPWILGVCSKIALKTNVEIGIVRFLTICLSFISLGATLIGYVVLYFVLDESSTKNSDSKPSTPPATM